MLFSYQERDSKESLNHWATREFLVFKQFWVYFCVFQLSQHHLLKRLSFLHYIFLPLLSKIHWPFSSVQFSHSVMSDSLRPHESQHARPPCLSPTPRAYSNSCPLSWWCYPAISSSAVPFSPHPLPASGSFPMSQLFTWCGQSTGVSASASVLPMNTQDWPPLGWTGWILQSKGLSRVFSNTIQQHQFFGA